MSFPFDDFRKRCSVVCEMLKVMETLEYVKDPVFYEDAYFILDFITMEEYSNVYYGDYSDRLIKDCLFHDLPKHYKEEKYFEDFVKMNMPQYTDAEIIQRYRYRVYETNPSTAYLFGVRCRVLKETIEHLAKLFKFIYDVQYHH